MLYEICIYVGIPLIALFLGLVIGFNLNKKGK